MNNNYQDTYANNLKYMQFVSVEDAKQFWKEMFKREEVSKKHK